MSGGQGRVPNPEVRAPQMDRPLQIFHPDIALVLNDIWAAR